MIDKETNPVVWALLHYELSDAQEHLGELLQEMQEQPDFDEEEYRIWLSHIYAHLNRAWNRRNTTDAQELIDQNKVNYWEGWTNFPADIKPG